MKYLFAVVMLASAAVGFRQSASAMRAAAAPV